MPRAAPHVAGLSALRSRVLTVIDCQRSLELGSTDLGGLREAAVVEVDGHHYALTVDAVEKYRLGAVKILEHVRPVIEREADLTLGEWVVGGAEPVQLRLAA